MADNTNKLLYEATIAAAVVTVVAGRQILLEKHKCRKRQMMSVRLLFKRYSE